MLAFCRALRVKRFFGPLLFGRLGNAALAGELAGFCGDPLGSHHFESPQTGAHQSRTLDD